MRPFNLQEYFKDLGDGWRINTITGSIFFQKRGNNNEQEFGKRSFYGIFKEEKRIQNLFVLEEEFYAVRRWTGKQSEYHK